MLESNESSALMEMADVFIGERNRAVEIANGGGKMTPPGQIKPMSVTGCRDACRELDLQEILPSKLCSDEELFMETGDPKALVNKYTSGKKICLAVIGFNKAGLPLGKKDLDKKAHFKRLEVRADGFTYNAGLEPGYYFLLLPEIIQKDVSEGGCSFMVPYFENIYLPSPVERAELKKLFRQAFVNLKALIDKVPGFKEVV